MAAPTLRSPAAPSVSRPARRAAVVVLAAALVLGAAACSGDDDGDAAEVRTGEGATLDATTTTAPPETTAPAETTTSVPATTGMATQEETVARLYDAWFADDRVTAATVAEPSAVDGMWQTARGDYSPYNRCSTGEFDTSGCLYRGANGTIQFTLEKRGDLWVVIEAFYAEP